MTGTHLLVHLNNARDPAVSPDGKSLIYIRMFENESDLWLANRDGSNPHSLTHDNVSAASIPDNYWAAQPTWSPDGTQVLYISDRAKQLGSQNVGQSGMAVWRLNVQSDVPVGPLLAPEAWTGGDADPTWRPSVPGQFALTRYHYDASVPKITGQIALSDGALLTHATDGTFQPSWSPDGRILAYVERQGSFDLLRVMVFTSPTSNAPSTPVTVSSGLLGHPVWSPDGRQLAFVSLQGNQFVMQTVSLTLNGQTVTVGTPKSVAGTEGIDAASSFSWAR